MQIAVGDNPNKRLGIGLPAFLAPPALGAGLVLAFGLSVLFWSLFKFTYSKWIETDGYYSHGFLVPLISAYIVYRWWPQLRQIKVRPTWLAAPSLLVCLWVAYGAVRTDIYSLSSLALVASLLAATWLVAGWKWMTALSAPIGYLLFGLPIWDQAINSYTNPLQLMSTRVAFHLLQLFGLHPVQSDPTTIGLGSYQLQIAVACSGFKLLLALIAFAAFFLLIARLKVWANLVFAASIVPIALFINGLRISLVGVVGHAYGVHAGAAFHDYSGYISIILCFVLLSYWAKLLGYRRDAELEAGAPAEFSPRSGKALSLRAAAIGALFLGCGLLAAAASKPRPIAGRNEAWMERIAPSRIGDYKVISTYRMEPSTYGELQPYGIVCRILGNGKNSFDVTLLASNRKTSFHDPRVCFPAQGWEFDNQERIQVKTDTRGTIPVSIIRMTGEDGTQQLAAYFYRGPHGFYPTPQSLSWAMLVDQFMNRPNDEGVFYRFMPEDVGATEAQLTAFIKEYMDEAPKTSGGFF